MTDEGAEAVAAVVREVEAAEALGNAIGAALEVGWTLRDLQRHAAEVWPGIVEAYGKHIATTALDAARGEEAT